MKLMLHRYLRFLTVSLWCILLGIAFPVTCRADLKDTDNFYDTEWTEIISYEMGDDMWLQSICSTDIYIVCLLNNDEEDGADRLLAFYKGSADADGNNVKPYSLALDVQEMDYEHGNGMTYNSMTNEIVIAAGNVKNSENKGCVFVIDGSTLKFKKKVQLSKKWNVQAIDYSSTTDSYIVQKNQTGDFEFVEYSTKFKKISDMENMVEMGFSGEANTFQDLCVCGDDIISLPRNKNEEYNGNLQVYSIKNSTLLGEYQIPLHSDEENVEVESISELWPGNFVLGASVGKKPARLVLYAAKLPMAYSVTTSIEHGTITESVEDVDLGSTCKIEWEPEQYYETSEVIVDGESVNLGDRNSSYSFNSITDNHTISVICTEIPKFEITTTAVNGSIDASMEIRRDESVTINFVPDEHYELDGVYIDGIEAEVDEDASSVTINAVTGAHEVQAVFKEKPAYIITTSVKNGSVSDAFYRVYQGDDATITFSGKEGFALKKLVVDGEIVPSSSDGTYTFSNVERYHDLEVYYRWIYLPLVYIGISITAAIVILWFALRKIRMYRHKRNLVMRNMLHDEMQERKQRDEMRAILLLDEPKTQSKNTEAVVDDIIDDGGEDEK